METSEIIHQQEPGPEFIAQQLRKPSGEAASGIAVEMNQVNRPLYDLTFETMNITDNATILEIGFANGRFFDEMFVRAKDIRLYGVDFSEEMVEEAKKLNADSIKKRIL